MVVILEGTTHNVVGVEKEYLCVVYEVLFVFVGCRMEAVVCWYMTYGHVMSFSFGFSFGLAKFICRCPLQIQY